MQEVLDANRSLKQELERLGWNSSQPLDFSMVYSRPGLKDQIQKVQWELEDLLSLTPDDFESLVGEVFRLKDTSSQVRLTPKTRDYGVDIVVTRGRLLRKREIVQCKRYRPKVKVSTPDMLQFVGSMKKFGVEKGYFVTTSTFSRYAAEVAEDTDVEMIDGDRLVQMIARIEDFPSPGTFVRRSQSSS
jgi:restriction endonuclease Mrr